MRLKTGSGVIVFLAGLPAWAQPATQAGTAASPASAPDCPNTTTVNDPTWFIAGLVTGLIVGAIGLRVLASTKGRA